MEIDTDAKCVGVGSDSWVWQEKNRAIKQFNFNSFRVGGDRLTVLTPEEATMKILNEYDIMQHIHKKIKNENVKPHIARPCSLRYHKTTGVPCAIEMENLCPIDIEQMLDLFEVPDTILNLATQLVAVMNVIHTECKIAHGDIKPFNCILEVTSTGNLKLVIVDWGSASYIQDQKTLGSGTLMYRAPELWGPVDPSKINKIKVDTWAIGCVILDWFIAGNHIVCKRDRFRDSHTVLAMETWWQLHFFDPKSDLRVQLEKLTRESLTSSRQIARMILQLLVLDPNARSSLSEILLQNKQSQRY